MPDNAAVSDDLGELSIPFANSYAALPERFFARQTPDPVREPKLIRLNTALCTLLGLDPAQLSSSTGADIFAGNTVPPGAEPIAQAYAGHQFGAPPAHIAIDTDAAEAVWFSAAGNQIVRLGQPLERPVQPLEAIPDWLKAASRAPDRTQA